MRAIRLPCVFFLCLPMPVFADALIEPGLSFSYTHSADYRASIDDSRGHADIWEAAAAWRGNGNWLASTRLQYINADTFVMWGGGMIDEWRAITGVTWREKVNQQVSISLGADLIGSYSEGTIVDPGFDSWCLSYSSCPPPVNRSETEWGAELSAGARVRPARRAAIFASAGYQALGGEHGPVLRGGFEISAGGNATMQFWYFDEPRIHGYGAGLSLRFGN